MNAIESIIQDYTVGVQRDCYFGHGKLELAERAREELAELRERAEKAERIGRCSVHSHAHAQCNGSGCGCICTDLARLARYEAPGPALLTAKHSTNYGEMCRQDGCGFSCTKPISDAAYREQHARCVAVVESVLADLEATNSGAAVGARRALAVLTEGATP